MVSPSFNEMTDDEIAEFVREHHAEFGEQKPNDADTILNKGKNKIIRRPQAFAVCRPSTENGPVMSYLYIAPESRGQGFGRSFVAEVVRELGGSCLLLCYDLARRQFFTACGFGIHPQSENGPRFTMCYPPVA